MTMTWGSLFVRGRGLSSVPQQQQPAIPTGGREEIPKLVYGINTNYPKWLEKITAYAVQIYNADGMFFHTEAYTNYPLVQLGEGYGAEDLEPDNDPGGILRDTILKENAIALQNRNAAGVTSWRCTHSCRTPSRASLKKQ